MATPLIICFGDSLTAGYQSPTREYPTICETPPGHFLQDRLGGQAQVMVSGACGELTGEMTMRFRQTVLDRKPHTVVILGGTNDLGWNADPQEIMRNLLKMYEQARGAGIRPVAVTAPSLRPTGDVLGTEGQRWMQDHLDRRHVLNRLIQDYAQSHRVPCVDLFTATAEDGTGWLAEPYSNDGLHLTTAGYRCFADLLYDEVFSAIGTEG
jgi:lysophospholipase L1-like esterase